MTAGFAFAASETFIRVGAIRVTGSIAAAVVRADQIQSVAKSLAFGIAPLQTTSLFARSVWVLARMG
jgi:hypothetical protein